MGHTQPLRRPAPPSPHARLLALASGLVGIQFSWAVQVGYVTKALLELGLPQRFVSYAWLAGPVAGVLMQPLVGIYSDRCTSRLGRRRPFLIAGTCVAAVCLLVFAFAAQIGARLGDRRLPAVGADDEGADGAHARQPRALVVAIAAFWALDFAINAAQGPLRALLADVVPTHYHNVGNAYFALATGVGNCVGSFMGSIPLATWWPVFPGDVQALYTLAAIVLLAFMSVTVCFVNEVPLEAAAYAPLGAGEEGGSAAAVAGYDSLNMAGGDGRGREGEEGQADEGHGSLSFLQAAAVAPYPFWHVFAVQCLSFFSWFTMFVFATSWVGSEVYHGRYDATPGSRERELYDAGVRMGNLGISLQSVLTIAAAPLLPSLLRAATTRRVYVASHVLLGAALCAALGVRERAQAWVAAALLASTGFSWAVTMTVPWSLMGEAVAAEAPRLAGVYYTMFNLSQCLPEIVVSLVAEEVERVTGSQAAVLGLGGVAALCGAALILWLRLGARVEGREALEEQERDQEQEKEEEEEEDAEWQEAGPLAMRVP